ncbi:hypothetical protein N8H74_26150 [Pseudomonas sp. B2M1-30]|nr:MULTISPECIES: hypothetical protein [Pseudomonas]MCU0121758.1 hypothetical protein [Pseudomonas sp. B2M1-30]MCU7263854.1 hypothetical protein [Pseudomonas koreensis]
MSKLGCKCGYVIVDQTDSLPYKARLLRDEAEEAYWREFERQIKTFVAAVEAGDKACYVAEYGTHSPWIKSSDLLINRLSSIQAHHETTIYECKGCGRL